ncbi:MAG: (2Fe-2S)-binding protein [Clostridia bacterium]
MEQKLYICEHCGQIIIKVKDKGVPVMCCGEPMKEYVPEAAPVCDLKPVNTKSNEDYIVCKCNNVSYFDILDAVQSHNNFDDLMKVFGDVKNTTKCSTGCGGCYDKVIEIISASMH